MNTAGEEPKQKQGTLTAEDQQTELQPTKWTIHMDNEEGVGSFYNIKHWNGKKEPNYRNRTPKNNLCNYADPSLSPQNPSCKKPTCKEKEAA